MKRHNDLVSRLFPGITLTLALAGAGCGVAVESEGPVDGVRPELPDLRPDLPNYTPDDDGVMRFRSVDGVLRPSVARGTADGGNADGVHSCAEGQPGYDHYEHGGTVNGTQLHVVGIYTSAEGALSFEPVIAPVDVKVNRPGTSVLVLSAYDTVEWNVAVAEGSTLERIIVSGYEEQIVNAPAGVPVARYSFEQDGAVLGMGFEWPSFTTSDLVDASEILTGLELTSFRGCYGGERFEIDEPGALRPPHVEDPATEPAIIAGCEALATESNYCIMENDYSGAGYTMLGLDSGTTCGQVTTGIDSQSYTEASLAWLGGYVYTCMPERGIARISIADGSVDFAPIMCSGVTSHDGGLLALVTFDPEEYSGIGSYVARFASFQDLVERNAEWIYEMAPWGTRMTAQGDEVFFAWHSTNEFDTAELADGAEFHATSLEGFDDWIMGMDVTEDGKLVMTGWQGEGVRSFDVKTGAALGFIPNAGTSSHLGGIECQSGGVAE